MLQHVSDHRGSIIREPCTVLGQKLKKKMILSCLLAWARLVFWQHILKICCHNTDLFRGNGHDRIILAIFNQALYKAP